MVFVLLVYVLFRRPLTFIIEVGRVSGREELKWHQLKHKAHKDLILVHTVQLKPTIKVQISGRMASIGISDVVTASVSSEETRMKKCMMSMVNIIINMNKSQEMTVFHRRQKLTSAIKQRAEK